MPVVHVRAWRKMECELRGDLQKTASEDLIELQFSTKRVNLHVCVHVRAWRNMEFELREDLLVL